MRNENQKPRAVGSSSSWRWVGALTMTALLSLAPGAVAGLTTGTVAVSIATRNPAALCWCGATWLFSPNGAASGSITSPAVYNPAGIVFDGANRLHMSRQADNFVGAPMDTGVYDSPSSATSTIPVGGIALALDAAGNLFVAPMAGGTLIEYTTSGGTQSFSIGRTADSLAVGSDQCTIYYSYASGGTGRIGRYNVCLNAPAPDLAITLAPFSNANGEQRSLRALPDQSLLVTEQTSARRIDVSGTVLSTYSIPAAGSQQWMALALDPTGSQFWVVIGSSLYRLDVASGSIVGGPFTIPASGIPTSMAVAGEWRPGSSPTASVPTLDSGFLAALVVALAVAATLRMKL